MDRRGMNPCPLHHLRRRRRNRRSSRSLIRGDGSASPWERSLLRRLRRRIEERELGRRLGWEGIRRAIVGWRSIGGLGRRMVGDEGKKSVSDSL